MHRFLPILVLLAACAKPIPPEEEPDRTGGRAR